jgi:hypothetical protein
MFRDARTTQPLIDWSIDTHIENGEYLGKEMQVDDPYPHGGSGWVACPWRLARLENDNAERWEKVKARTIVRTATSS